MYNTFIESWGCPVDYYMVLGKCFKLFRESKSQMEAQMKCKENNGLLVQPKTYVESEFLESFINKMDEIRSDTEPPTDAVWLKFRRGRIHDASGQYFSPFSGHSNANLRLQTGDCIMIKVDNGTHQGWHRSDCNASAFFICEKSIFSSSTVCFLYESVKIFFLYSR